MSRDRSFKEQAEARKGRDRKSLKKKDTREERKIIEREAAGAVATTES